MRSCTKCGRNGVEIVQDYPSDDYIGKCIYCGNRTYLDVELHTIEVTKDRIGTRDAPILADRPRRPKRRLISLTPKESANRWRKSPAGKRSIQRYQDSILFKEAHERHRKTEKYKESQKRFHDKRKELKRIEEVANCRCSEGIYDKGMTYDGQDFFCKICGRPVEQDIS